MKKMMRHTTHDLERLYAQFSTVADAVQTVFGVSREDLSGSTHRRAASEARFAFCYVSHVMYPGVTYEDIGRFVARHYSTTHYAVESAETFRTVDKVFDERIKRVLNIVTQLC